MWTYCQSSGKLYEGTQEIGQGYSGYAHGKNNPSFQEVHDVGPIPAGDYNLSRPYNDHERGPIVMRLTPVAKTNTFGRDGFLMHGDSIHDPGTASHGCIIMPATVRAYVAQKGGTLLRVVL